MAKGRKEDWVLVTKPNGCMVNMTRKQYEKWLEKQQKEETGHGTGKERVSD